MKQPYAECTDCVAKIWCKRYTGEVPDLTGRDWCNPKFRLDKATALNKLPKKYQNANIYTFKVDHENEEIYNELKTHVDDIVSTVDGGKNFFFSGQTPGNGKTFAGAVLLNHYMYKTCVLNRFDFEHPLALYVDYSELMDRLRYSRDDEELQAILQEMKDVPILLLDDIGAGKVTDFALDQTFLISNYRHNNELSTIYTTNLTKREQVEVFGTRLVSRMKANSLEIEFNGRKDRRKGN